MRLIFVPMLLLAQACFAAPPPALNEVPVGATVEVPAFSFSADQRFSAPLSLRRIDIYAPDARILRALPGGGFAELPRSDRHYFIAERDKTASRLFLSVSADGRDVRGSLFNAEQTFDFEGRIENGVVETQHFSKSRPEDHQFSCGNLAHLHAVDSSADQPGLPDLDLAALKASLPKAATHQATLAIDTDNELLDLRFGNSESAATTYLADLVAGMNVAYARDLGFNLVQGTTVLRAQPVSGADPYSETSTGGQLGEVGREWSTAPLLAENRAFVILLSGKSPGTNSGSGVAWVLGGSAANYCTAKDVPSANPEVVGHYSATQIIRGTGFPASTNVNLVGHEIGHNLGASHTHCSDRTTGAGGASTNTIDQCYNAEGSCYSGAPACPSDNSVNGRGSLMSYCNFGAPNGAACGQTLNEFHPAHQTLIAPRVTSNINNACFKAIVSDQGPLLSPSPANGSTTAMPAGSQGQTVSRSISFAVSGGTGSGTTTLSCSGSGAVSVASGTPQTIAVSGSASPVVAQLTLSSAPRTGAVSCTMNRAGIGSSSFTFNFTAAAGSAACTGSCVFRNGFE